MNMSELRLRRCAIAATLLCVEMSAMGQTTSDPVKEEPKPAPATQPDTPISTTSSLEGSNLFNVSNSPAQQSFTPSSELRAGSVSTGQAGLMTVAGKGAPIVSGGMYWYMDATLQLGRNDNLIGSNTNSLATTFYSLIPEIVAEVKNHGDRYTASYLGNFTRFTSSSNDNFNHHEFKLAGDDIFSARTKAGWAIGYVDSTDARGSTDRSIATEPDHWHAPTLAGILSYGAPGAQGRFEFDGSYQDKRYTNNRSTTAGSDVDLYSLSGRFLYRIAPKTSLLTELKELKSNYVLSTSTNSNTDRRLNFGLTWDATAATTGIVKIGYSSKKFNSPLRSNFSGIDWEAQIRWKPLTYSTFDLATSKIPSDSTGVGDYVLNTNYSLTWTHAWSSTLSSHANLGWLRSEYVNATPARSDNTKNIGFGLGYSMRRWLWFGFDWTHTNRDSTLSNLNFGRNVIFFSAQIAL